VKIKLNLVAVNCLNRANEIFLKNGRFHIAATHEKEIAEIYEQTLNEPEKAIKYYLSAADRFSIDDSVAIAQGCSLKAATISAEIEKYEEAAKLFESIAEDSANDQLRKYSVKDYLFRAGLCRLCLDVN
jgi:alpha-soluble NSF attachment protein